jgi:hypothetical protein
MFMYTERTASFVISQKFHYHCNLLLINSQVEPDQEAQRPAGPQVPILPVWRDPQAVQWAHHGANHPEKLCQTGMFAL